MKYLFFLVAIIFLFGCTDVVEKTKIGLRYDSCQNFCEENRDIGCFANTKAVTVSSGDFPDCSCNFKCESLDVAIKVSDLRCVSSGGKCSRTCDNATDLGKLDCYTEKTCCK